MFEPFMIRAFLAGLGIALIAGPLGCFVLWRRMAYFGDTLAHAGLMGIAFGLLWGIDATVGVVVVCILIAALLFVLQAQRRVPTDTLLGVLSHSALAIGLIAVSFVQSVRVDLMAYLFGDILAITITDLAWIYGGGALILIGLMIIWRRLIAITVNEDIARAEGLGGAGVRLAFTGLIAVTVAIAMKIVGILLVTALLIIPAAAARRVARSPEGMAMWTVAMGGVSALAGIAASFTWDTPSGASIVAAAAVIFALSATLGGLRRS